MQVPGHVRAVIGFVESSMREHGLPVPVSREVIYRWSEGLGLPGRGDTYLFTGGLYQLAPYIEAMVRFASVIEKDGMLSGIASRLSSTFIARSLARALARVDRVKVERFNSIVRGIALALRGSGVSYAYSRGADAYSGVILYDLGLEDLFAEHASRIYKSLKVEGARRIVTIDPHTTLVMRDVYPRYVDGYDLEVHSYLELLHSRPGGSAGAGEVVIHDPCLYARNLGIVEEPRKLLHSLGYRVREPRRARRMTYCCGGPIEALFPTLAKRVAKTRMNELAMTGASIVVMCPICLTNLSSVAPSGVNVRDLGELLGESGTSEG